MDLLFFKGNDSGSTGDASSTAGESAAASGAALQTGYGDATPLVCFPSKFSFRFFFLSFECVLERDCGCLVREMTSLESKWR